MTAQATMDIAKSHVGVSLTRSPRNRSYDRHQSISITHRRESFTPQLQLRSISPHIHRASPRVVHASTSVTIDISAYSSCIAASRSRLNFSCARYHHLSIVRRGESLTPQLQLRSISRHVYRGSPRVAHTSTLATIDVTLYHHSCARTVHASAAAAIDMTPKTSSERNESI